MQHFALPSLNCFPIYECLPFCRFNSSECFTDFMPPKKNKKRADAICFPQTLHWMSLRVTKTDTHWELKLEYFHSLIHHYLHWNSLLVSNRNQVHQDQLRFLWKTCQELTIKFSMIFDPEFSFGKSNRQCTHRVSKNPVWGIMGGCQITWKKILIQRFGVGSIGNNKMLLVSSN